MQVEVAARVRPQDLDQGPNFLDALELVSRVLGARESLDLTGVAQRLTRSQHLIGPSLLLDAVCDVDGVIVVVRLAAALDLSRGTCVDTDLHLDSAWQLVAYPLDRYRVACE